MVAAFVICNLINSLIDWLIASAIA